MYIHLVSYNKLNVFIVIAVVLDTYEIINYTQKSRTKKNMIIIYSTLVFHSRQTVPDTYT